MTTFFHEKKSLNSIIEALRKKGYKATPQRIAVCRYALQSPTHPTAKAIYQKVREEYPTISLATVYKTLKVLKELDLIQELPFFQGQTRFDPNVNPHINMVCLKCGKIIDLNNTEVGIFIQKLAQSAKFRLKGQRLDIYGFCEKCFKG
ncbi:MAG: transcriptional repressor [Candidatus Bathyarchaeota archaeon]|nr:transcriptional repressor [Candidatus Bathyarchaeota archaeon]